MDFKNYTTQIDALKTIGEIEKILTKHGATGIMKTFDNEIVDAIYFMIKTKNGNVSYKLPCDVFAIRKVMMDLKRNGKLGGISHKTAQSVEHARRVGWRVIKDWLLAQLTLIQVEMVTLDQIFLPYAYDGYKTLYERIQAGEINLLLGD